MMNFAKISGAAISVAALAVSFPVAAQDTAAKSQPTFEADGTVNVPAFELPPSELSSPEAQKMQSYRARASGAMETQQNPDINASRAALAALLAPQVELMQSLYPVTIEEGVIAGVPVRIVTPADGEYDPDRVLINLHGGAFNTCWEACSLLESIPIASLGGYKVISVNYRMAPEHKHPAGVEDVASVYGELLNEYDPRHIGIYGCSAGGALTAQAGAYLPANGLPQAGALGIFGAGGIRFGSGDSAYIAGYIDGSFGQPAKAGEASADLTRGYFDGYEMADASISPALHPDIMAGFPPTMILTGTRAMDMSPAIVTNSALLKAGVETTMIVGEGMGHCYLYTPTLSESQDAYAVTVAFFSKHLK